MYSILTGVDILFEGHWYYTRKVKFGFLFDTFAVRAIDGDKGINNKVTYSITEGPKYLFDIDATSGLVFTRGQLDREAKENSDGTFILEITVKEVSKIVPAPSVTTEVTIILTDVNDETPKFRSPRYLAEINENVPQNTPVNFIGDSVPEVYDHDLVSR